MLFPELQSLEEFEFICNLGSGYSSMYSLLNII